MGAPGARSQTRDTWVRTADSPAVDAFGRLRVSNPVTLFDSQQQFGDNDINWVNAVAGTGVVSHQLTRASVLLSTGGTASGARAYRSTRTHFRYQPLKGEFVALTFVMGAAVTNARKRIGFFDERDGIFLQQTSAGLAFVLRSYVTGAAVDTVVLQDAWSEDTFRGRGPSGKVLNITTAQILLIDYQWLGAGRIRLGFDIDGVEYEAHRFENANNLDVVYMTNPNLPVRAEVENTGVAGGTATLEQICAAVVSEGGFEVDRGFPFTADTTATPISVSTRRPVLSIRAKTTGPNGVLNVGQIIPQGFNVLSVTNSTLVEIVEGGTLTGASWTSVDAARSIAEYDRAASAITGGRVIDSFLVPAGGGGPFTFASSAQKSPFARNPVVYVPLDAVSSQRPITVVCTAITGASPSSVVATMNWQELY